MFRSDPFGRFILTCVVLFVALVYSIPRFLWVLIIIFVILVIGSRLPAEAHDPDHHEHDEWYSQVQRPDMPKNGQWSCCGIADGYFCDDLTRNKDGLMECIITDDRDDKERDNRLHVPVGTKIVIPQDKLIGAGMSRDDPNAKDSNAALGNPTGHGIVWMKGTNIYCYMMGLLT